MSFLDGFVDAVENIVDMVLADLLLLEKRDQRRKLREWQVKTYKIRKDQEIRQTRHSCQQLRRQLRIALSGARLHNQHDAIGIGEALAGHGEVVLGMDMVLGAVEVQSVVVDLLLVGEIGRDIVVEFLGLLAVIAGIGVAAELPEGHGQQQG